MKTSTPFYETVSLPGNDALHAHALVAGYGKGQPAVIEPLSFWGGYQSETGTIVDRTHAAFGQSLAGRILVMPRAKGSSSSSSVLAEALRNGTGPAGIVLAERDLIVTIGVIVASELYRSRVPVVVADEAVLRAVTQANANGAIELEVTAPSTSELAVIRVMAK
jgi:predicted aconitase with swiveling domain